MAPVYATPDDLAAWLPDGTPMPPDAERRLALASRTLDRALLTAVYDIDDTGAPTDPDVAEAFAAATCSIASDRIISGASGAGAGSGGGWTSVTAGPVSMSRSGPDPVAEGAVLPQAAVDALTVLPSHKLRLGVVAVSCWW